MIQRPRNISLAALLKYRFPLTALASILHRLSGFFLYLMIPFVLWILHLSLSSQAQFLMVQDYFGLPWVSFLVWLVLSALFYHFIAGLKHLLMDMGHFEGLRSSRIASLFVLVLGVFGSITIGVWIVC